MKKIVVTGADGFIGGHLSAALADRGYKVFAVIYRENSFNNNLRHENIVKINGDLFKYEEIAGKINTDIDVLVHLAWNGISSVDYKDINIQKKNIDISVNAVELAKKLDCKRFVFGGSMYEHMVAKTAYSQLYTSASVYGTCKYCANKLCEVLAINCMEYVPFAFTNVFGDGDCSARTPNTFINKMMKGQELDLIDGNNPYDWVYVSDAVDGVIAVIEKGVSGKQYIISNRKLATFREIIEKVRDIVNPDAKLNFGKYNDNTVIDFGFFDIDAWYRDTGFECRADFKESVLKTAQWVEKLSEGGSL